MSATRSLATVAPAWDELADRADAPPWMRPGWLDAWWRAFGRGRLDVATAHRGSDLAAAVALAQRRGSASALANWHSPSFDVLADDPDARDHLARAVFARDEAPVVTLRLVPGDDGSAATLADAARSCGRRVASHVQQRSPYVALDAQGTGYPRASTLQAMRRQRRRLEASGDVAFDVQDGTEALDGPLEEGFAIEASGWQGDRGTAIVSKPQTRAFYTEVARWAARRGWLRLMFLRLDGRAIAFDLCIEAAGSLYLLKRGFDPAHRRNGPGRILIFESIAYARARSLRSYEMLGDDEEYKLKWTDLVRERTALRAFAPTPTGHAAWFAYTQGRPPAERAVTWARGVQRPRELLTRVRRRGRGTAGG